MIKGIRRKEFSSKLNKCRPFIGVTILQYPIHEKFHGTK